MITIAIAYFAGEMGEASREMTVVGGAHEGEGAEPRKGEMAAFAVLHRVEIGSTKLVVQTRKKRTRK